MTSAHASHFDDLLPAYALGALDGDELRELAAHLATGCPTCEGELRRLAAGLGRRLGELLGLPDLRAARGASAPVIGQAGLKRPAEGAR